MIFDPIKSMQESSEKRRLEIEKENRIFRNCERQYITKYVFQDKTEIFDKTEAVLYSDKYYESLNKLYSELNNYIVNPLSITQDYKQYDKYIINNFKKDFYNILWNIFKDYYGESRYNKYFEKFANNPENDMEGAARCLNSFPFKWNLVNYIGIILLSFDHLGRYFGTFKGKCDFWDKEYLLLNKI